MSENSRKMNIEWEFIKFDSQKITILISASKKYSLLHSVEVWRWACRTSMRFFRFFHNNFETWQYFLEFENTHIPLALLFSGSSLVEIFFFHVLVLGEKKLLLFCDILDTKNTLYSVKLFFFFEAIYCFRN